MSAVDLSLPGRPGILGPQQGAKFFGWCKCCRGRVQDLWREKLASGRLDRCKNGARAPSAFRTLRPEEPCVCPKLCLELSSTTPRTLSTPTREELMGSVDVFFSAELRTNTHTSASGRLPADSASIYPAGWELGENSSVYPGWAEVSAVNNRELRRLQEELKPPGTRKRWKMSSSAATNDCCPLMRLQPGRMLSPPSASAARISLHVRLR